VSSKKAAPLSRDSIRARAQEPQEKAILAANVDYWGGRPYLDEIEISMRRPPFAQFA
jgi:ABC-type transport system substrate-binding protein